MNKHYPIGIFLLAIWGLSISCDETTPIHAPVTSGEKLHAPTKASEIYYILPKAVNHKNYLDFMDELVQEINGIWKDYLDEYDLVQYNPWLMEQLAATDYYRLREQGTLIRNLDTIRIFAEGDTLFIPGREQLNRLDTLRKYTRLEVNIPEFALRILRQDSILFEFPVRVGRNQARFLAMANQEVDMKTRTGEGHIVRVNKEPLFINPLDNHRYEQTVRDDGVVTTLPHVPWLIPEVNGIEHGQLIHPTTNPETLGKAVSNGCIGTRESDAWYIYYHAPPGTPIKIQYLLERITPEGDTLQFKDIYNRKR